MSECLSCDAAQRDASKRLAAYVRVRLSKSIDMEGCLEIDYSSSVPSGHTRCGDVCAAQTIQLFSGVVNHEQQLRRYIFFVLFETYAVTAGPFLKST